jgi:hypothetical protein
VQLITCLAVVPTFMGLAALVTGSVLGDRDTRGLLFGQPLGFFVTFVIAMLFVLAWWLLGRRRRAGVLLASALFAWMLLSSVVRPNPSWLGAAFALLGLALASRAWPAMHRPARQRVEPTAQR